MHSYMLYIQMGRNPFGLYPILYFLSGVRMCVRFLRLCVCVCASSLIFKCLLHAASLCNRLSVLYANEYVPFSDTT